MLKNLLIPALKLLKNLLLQMKKMMMVNGLMDMMKSMMIGAITNGVMLLKKNIFK